MEDLGFNILLKSSDHISEQDIVIYPLFQYSIEILAYSQLGVPVIAMAPKFQYSIEIFIIKISLSLYLFVVGPFNILLKSSVSLVYLFLYKYFLLRVWAPLEYVSAPNFHGSCLFSRSLLGIELLFPRIIQFHLAMPVLMVLYPM